MGVYAELKFFNFSWNFFGEPASMYPEPLMAAMKIDTNRKENTE